jgi:hypothetical protein
MEDELLTSYPREAAKWTTRDEGDGEDGAAGGRRSAAGLRRATRAQFEAQTCRLVLLRALSGRMCVRASDVRTGVTGKAGVEHAALAAANRRLQAAFGLELVPTLRTLRPDLDPRDRVVDMEPLARLSQDEYALVARVTLSRDGRGLAPMELAEIGAAAPVLARAERGLLTTVLTLLALADRQCLDDAALAAQLVVLDGAFESAVHPLFGQWQRLLRTWAERSYLTTDSVVEPRPDGVPTKRRLWWIGPRARTEVGAAALLDTARRLKVRVEGAASRWGAVTEAQMHSWMGGEAMPVAATEAAKSRRRQRPARGEGEGGAGGEDEGGVRPAGAPRRDPATFEGDAEESEEESRGRDARPKRGRGRAEGEPAERAQPAPAKRGRRAQRADADEDE